jgi:NAD(P)H dehydrogenase (quinone)
MDEEEHIIDHVADPREAICCPNRKHIHIVSHRRKYKATSVAALPSSSPPPLSPSQTLNMSSPKIAIVIYSMYGHVAKRSCPPYLLCPSLTLCAVAESVKAGIESAGGSVKIYQ